MIPPFRTPLKASYFFSGFHSATTSPPARDSSEFFVKLRICKPFGFDGPQPKQLFRGAYFSWSDCSTFMLQGVSVKRDPNGAACKGVWHRRPTICFTSRR